jgi:hypothetical protein
MQVALVVHVAQALWAEALMEATFDAEAWLRRLNGTLVALGARRLQPLAIGIAVIGEDEVTYWGAGLPPLVVVTRPGESGATVQRLAGTEDVLGLGHDLTLEPRSLRFEAGVGVEVLLGTRVFPESAKAADLAVRAERDDRILVRVSCPVAGAGAELAG